VNNSEIGSFDLGEVSQHKGAISVSSCPACDGSDVAQASGVGIPFAADNSSDYTQPAFVLHECGRCGLHYKTPRPSDEFLSRYYSTLPHESYDQVDLFPTDEIILRAVRDLVPVQSRVLDFGCGAGRLWSRTNDDVEVFGIEVNERARHIAEFRGVKIVAEEAVLKGEHGRFHSIVLSDVYEHLAKPFDTIRSLCAHIESGGYLVICTGNATILEQPFGLHESWYTRIYGHLQIASRRHFEWVARELGGAVVQHAATSHYRFQLVRALRQSLRCAAFRLTRIGRVNSTTRLFMKLPFLRRASRWKFAPVYEYAKDHSVTVIQVK
jgi:2-polyprenyl-3-methyl-5-hydroxy-6-metoxy-1,4-benzoquinol methylase